MSADIKNAIDAVNSAFEQFKTSNDQRLAEMEKSYTNSVDALVTEKTDRINADITAKMDDLKELQNKGLEDLEASIKMANIGAGSGDAKASDLDMFNKLVKDHQFSAEEFTAYKQEMNNYMRTGRISNNMKVSEDPSGGFWVDPSETGRMAELIYESSPMRQICSVTTIGTDALEGAYDLEEVNQGWVAEMGSRSETSTPDLGKYRIEVHEQYAMPKISQKLLDDSSVNVENFLRTKVSDKFARTENAGFVTGDGNGKPKGILSYGESSADITSANYGTFIQSVSTGTSGGFDGTNPGDNIIDLIYALKPAYRNGARFLMNRATEATARKFKDGQGNYLWQPDFTQLGASMLAGFSITTGEDMPDLAADSLSVAFGNFQRAYQIVDRTGIRLIRDNVTDKGQILMYFTKRVGGGMVDFDAIKLLKFA